MFMIPAALLNLTASLTTAIRRFPVPALLAVLFCVITQFSLLKHEVTMQVALSLVFGFFIFIAVQLFAEMRGLGLWKTYAAAAAITAAASTHLFLYPDYLLTPFLLLSTAFFLSIFIAPFVNRPAGGQEIWNFSYRISVHILITLLAALVLFCGIAAIMLALDFLFGIDMYREAYVRMGAICATLFAPLYALSGVPQDCRDACDDYPRIFRLIVCNLVLPLILIYALILYAYAVKILWQQKFPNGEAGVLVCLFGLKGVLAYLISFPLRHQQPLAKLFHRYFFILLSVPLILLALAIYIRIDAYGLTGSRYLVVICLAWLTATAAFRYLGAEDGMPRWVLQSLVVLMLLLSFGPWSLDELPQWQQKARLAHLLKENSILVNDRIVPGPKDIDAETARNISDSFYFFVGHSHHEDKIREWFADMPQAEINQKERRHNYAQVVRDIGISNAEPEISAIPLEEISYELPLSPRIDVSGFKYFFPIHNNYNITFTSPMKIENAADSPQLTLRGAGTTYVVELGYADQPTAHTVSLDFQPYLDQLAASGSLTSPALDADLGPYHVRILITRLSGYRSQGEKAAKFRDIDAVLLIRDR